MHPNIKMEGDGSEKYSPTRDRSRSPVGGNEGNNIERDNDRSERDRTRSWRNENRNKRNDRPNTGGRRGRDRRIYVSNIPYEFKWQDLKDLFRKEVGEVSFVEMANDENNRPRGCAVIEFELAESVGKAISQMHRYELKGRKLVVKEDGQDDRMDRGGGGCGGRDMGGRKGGDMGGGRRDYGSRGGMGMGGMGGGPDIMPPAQKYGNTYGLSTVFLESLGINSPLVNKVFAANLDYKVNDKELKDVFKIAGRVVNVEINKDADGKSRGFGVVEFEHPVEAVQSISMFNNQCYYDRKMSVRMDRASDKPDSHSAKLPPGLKGLGMGLGINGSALTDVSSQTSSGGSV